MILLNFLEKLCTGFKSQFHANNSLALLVNLYQSMEYDGLPSLFQSYLKKTLYICCFTNLWMVAFFTPCKGTAGFDFCMGIDSHWLIDNSFDFINQFKLNQSFSYCPGIAMGFKPISYVLTIFCCNVRYADGCNNKCQEEQVTWVWCCRCSWIGTAEWKAFEFWYMRHNTYTLYWMLRL